MAAVSRDALRRRTPDRIAWIVAFGMFGAAAGAEVIGDTAGWNETLVRIYYLTGAVLVVGFLALGQLYLLAADRIRRVAPGIALLITAVSASTVWGAPIDHTRMSDDGWDAITRTTGLTILAVSINSIGTLILLGGLVYAAIRFRRVGTQRNRMIGSLLIAVGTLAVAMGGTLTRFGSEQYLYIAMSLGVALIFTGYVWTKRLDSRGGEEASRRAVGREGAKAGRREEPTGHGKPKTDNVPQSVSPAISFIEARLRSLSDAELSDECRVWSVPVHDIDAFSRAEARRVWSFRNRLSLDGRAAFDSRPAGLRLQLAELYFEVMAPEFAAIERPTIAPLDRLADRDHPDAFSRAAAGSVD
jgi:hypothetical protein